jgi:hypothetical protein
MANPEHLQILKQGMAKRVSLLSMSRSTPSARPRCSSALRVYSLRLLSMPNVITSAREQFHGSYLSVKRTYRCP